MTVCPEALVLLLTIPPASAWVDIDGDWVWGVAIEEVTVFGGEEEASDSEGEGVMPMFGRSFISVVQKSGNISWNLFCFRFHAWLRDANTRLWASVELTEPVVISSESINDKSPVRMVATLHAGFQEAGWKSDIEKHIFLSGWNLPDGVNILIPGGLKGYSEGKSKTPWYSPPSNGESGGPRMMKCPFNVTIVRSSWFKERMEA
jgi:hypothetical protein